MRFLGNRALALALALSFLVFARDGAVWVRQRDGAEQQLPCALAGLPQADRAALEAGIRVTDRAALSALVENFCS